MHKMALKNSTAERQKKHKPLYDTVINHFSGFLRYFNEENPEQCPYTEYDASVIPKEFYTQNVYAMYCDYVLNELPNVKKLLTASGYMSRIKNQICRDYDDPDLIKEQWHSDVLRDVATHFTDQCAMTGERLVDSAPAATQRDVEVLCALLFGKNTPESMTNRALITLHLQSLGRIKELFLIHHEHITLHSSSKIRCLKVSFSYFIM